MSRAALTRPTIPCRSDGHDRAVEAGPEAHPEADQEIEGQMIFCHHCKRTIGKTQAKVVINEQWWCGDCAYHYNHQPDGQMTIHEGHVRNDAKS